MYELIITQVFDELDDAKRALQFALESIYEFEKKEVGYPLDDDNSSYHVSHDGMTAWFAIDDTCGYDFEIKKTC